MGGRDNSKSPSTSASLLARAKNQEPDAWAVIVEIYSPLILKWLRRRGLRESEVEDVAQDVLRGVFMTLGTFQKTKQTDSFRKWLKTITNRNYTNFVRKNIHSASGAGGTTARGQIEQIPVIDNVDEAGEEQEFLKNKIAELIRSKFTEEQFDIFLESSVGGQSSREVGEKYGKTQTAVDQINKRIRKFVRESLHDLGDFDDFG